LHGIFISKITEKPTDFVLIATLLNLVVTTTLLDQLGPWSWGKGPYAGDAWADGWLESEGEW